MSEINDREAQVYDRQIRLWGVEAQKRIQSAKVLISGMRALNAEVCKNLVLAGINATIQDHETVTAADCGAQFFLTQADIGKNRAAASLGNVKELNALVTVDCVTEPLSSQPDSFFDQFMVVCLTDCPPELQIKINKICRDKNISFFVADTFGFDGLFFVDLNKHTYRISPMKADQKASDPKEVQYSSLEAALSPKWDSLSDRFGAVSNVYVAYQMLQNFYTKTGHRIRVDSEAHFQEDLALFQKLCTKLLAANGMAAEFIDPERISALARTSTAEISPVCAILGGMVGQEVVKAVSAKDEPINNFFFWNGLAGSGIAKCIPPAPKKKPAAVAMDLDEMEVL